MMDTCVQAVEWTLDEKTVRIEKNPSIGEAIVQKKLEFYEILS